MAKVPNAPWYTGEHWVKHNPPVEFVWADGSVDYHRRTVERSEDGTLFSRGVYPTKFIPGDLPMWYVRARVYKLWGWVNARTVKGVAHIPNTWINHLFRDDVLLVSYKHSYEGMDPRQCLRHGDYDFALDGWTMAEFACAAIVFMASCRDDAEAALVSMREKVELYRTTHPDEHDCIEVAEFDKAVREYTERYKDRVVDSVFA